MFVVGFLVIFLLGLFFPQKISAAFYLSSVSAATVNSADEEIIIFATASGLTTSPQYFQAVFTKKDEAANYFGLTQNLSGEWYAYKSSPTLIDLQNYFYKFDFSGSSWSGQLKTKIDITDDGFKGPGVYLLKLYKYITSSASTSNNYQEITINVASISANTPSGADDANGGSSSVPDPSISWVLPTSGKLGENFKVTYSLKDFPANTDYYVKVRGAQTKNGNNYLSENEAWTGFPVVKIKNDGSFDGEVYALVSDEKDAGDYSCKLRFRKKDSDSFVEAESKDISLTKIVVVSINKAKVASNSSILAIKSAVLGTTSSEIKPASPAGKSFSKPLPNPASFLWPIGLIIAGLGFIGAALFPSLKQHFANKKAP